MSCYLISFNAPNNTFFLESIRVEHFCKIAKAIDDDEDEEDAVEQMSELLSKSHASLKTLYECSHKNLDELVNIAKSFGVGARLTGAGKNFDKMLENIINFFI